jgi:hypothetical protein
VYSTGGRSRSSVVAGSRGCLIVSNSCSESARVVHEAEATQTTDSDCSGTVGLQRLKLTVHAGRASSAARYVHRGHKTEMAAQTQPMMGNKCGGPPGVEPWGTRYIVQGV